MCKECEVLTPQEFIEKFDNRLAEMIGAVEETAVDGMMDRINQAKYDVLCYVRNEFRQLRKDMYPHSCIERKRDIRKAEREYMIKLLREAE